VTVIVGLVVSLVVGVTIRFLLAYLARAPIGDP